MVELQQNQHAQENVENMLCTKMLNTFKDQPPCRNSRFIMSDGQEMKMDILALQLVEVHLGLYKRILSGSYCLEKAPFK